MQLQIKRIQIELFGQKLWLSERTALDSYLLVEIAKEFDDSFQSVVLVNSIIVYDALKINFKLLKPYQFIKKWKLKRLITRKNLIEKLSFIELDRLASKVLELEGIKKKVTANPEMKKEPSAEELQDV